MSKPVFVLKNKLGQFFQRLYLEHSVMFERIKSSQTILDIPTAPEWLRPLLAVAYLRAKLSVKSGKTAKILSNPNASIDKVIKLTDNLEHNFLGELLVQTVIRAKEDSKFAKKLNDAASEFKQLVEKLYTHEAKNPGVTAKAANNNGGVCTACRTDPSGITDCQPISCRIIVIIVIIIVVGK